MATAGAARGPRGRRAAFWRPCGLTRSAPLIYLDHAATAPLRDPALAAMLPFLRDAYGNPSSLHAAGRRARVAVDHAREMVAGVMGCEPGEVLFTSGGTEADNAALAGVLTSPELREAGRTALLTSPAEHEAVVRAAERLASGGTDVRWLRPGPDAAVAASTVADALAGPGGEAVALVSLMAVNNEVGTVTDVAAVARAARAAGALVHTDAVQAAGLLDVRLGTLGADLVTLSSHKVGGPKGAGALVVRQGTPFRPFVVGGAQERGRRGGTENVAAIVGFAAALAATAAERETEHARLSALRGRLVGSLRSALGDRLAVTTPLAPGAAAPHILSVSLRPGAAGPVDGEMLLAALDLDGVAVSAGSACTSGALEPSHVLRAAGVDRATAGATVRFSLGRTTTEAEVDEAAAAYVRIARRLAGAG